MRRNIKIKFQNGITKEIACREILNGLEDHYYFEESSEPNFILFGPYGNDIPKPGKYIRIGYFCENIIPDMSICEWAFGVPREEEINHPNYKRIQWHNLDPEILVKPANYNAESIFLQKKHFCNFLYSNKVAYREEFFKQLSKYKKIDAPGLSMNNMQNVDKLYQGDIWQRKRQFLSSYKFTIAFENYVYPGYQTEKLYDAMQANSMPIYCGDPYINEIFNTDSFVNLDDYIKNGNSISKWLEKKSQPTFIDIRPLYYHNPIHRIQRKFKAIGRNIKMNIQLGKLDFTPLIEQIIELDRNDDKYISTLKQPWLINNQPPVNASNKARWIKIFNTTNE